MTALFRNTIFMLLFNVFGRASGLIRYILLAHFLGETEFGVVYIAMAFAGISRNFIDGGLDNLVTRDGARRKDMLPTYTATALAIKSSLAVIFILFTLGYVNIGEFTPLERWTILVAVTFSGTISLTGVIRSGFSALERMEYVFYTHAPCRILALAYTFCALFFQLPLWAVVACMYSENVFWFALCFYFIHRFYRIADGSCSLRAAWAMLKESWPLAVYGFFNVLYLRMDALMLKWLVGSKSTGIYGYSNYLVEGVTLVVSGYIVAVFPVFSRLYPGHEERFRALYRQSLSVMLAIMLPAAIVLGGFAPVWSRLFQMLRPESNNAMAILLPVLAWTMVSAISNSFLISIFTARDRQRWLVVLLLIAVVLSFTTNYILIPRYSYIGAAVASLFSQYVLFIIMLLILRIRMNLVPPIARWLGIAACCFVAYGLSLLLPESLWLARPFVFGLLVPVILFGCGILGMKDIREFRALATENQPVPEDADAS